MPLDSTFKKDLVIENNFSEEKTSCGTKCCNVGLMLSCVADGLNVEAYVIIQYKILSSSANVIMWSKCYSCGLYFYCVE